MDVSIDWDDFKVFLEEKGFADRTVKYETSVAKRVIRNEITEDNMYDRCPIITRYVRHDIRRGIKRIDEYLELVKDGSITQEKEVEALENEAKKE